MVKISFCLFFVLLGGSVFPQKQADRDKDLRDLPLPYYNFGKGIGLTSPDSLFQFNIRFRMQNRVSYFHQKDKEDRISAENRRLRLRFDGFVGNPKFTYAIQLSFATGDTGGGAKEGGNTQIIRDAVVWYQPNRRWNVGFGQTKLPGNRQRMNSSGALQFSDRSINNARFSIDRDFGLQIHHLNEFKDRFSYNLKTAITTGEGRNDTSNPDVGLAYTGKAEFFPFGPFKNNGVFFEGDLMREERPKLMVSGAYSHNSNASKTQGQLGNKLFAKRDMNALFLDAVLKYKGWAFMAAYMDRNADRPVTVNPLDGSDVSFVYAGNGMDYQASYLFRNDFEVLARYSRQKMHRNVARFAPDQNQYSFGITKYIWEHAFKTQAELTFDQFGHAKKGTENQWYCRFQVEIGI